MGPGETGPLHTSREQEAHLTEPELLTDTASGRPLGHILGSAEKPGWSPPSPCSPVPNPSLDIVSGRLEAQVGFCEEGTSERGPRGKSWQRGPIASDHGP